MENLYNTFKTKLENNLVFLDDKPEENVDSTLHALWHKASGSSYSAKKAIECGLPKLDEAQIALLNELIYERISGKPLAHITQRQNFMGIEFVSDNRALIPRVETEILAGAALKLSQELGSNQDTVKILDVCCGSGNVGLSIAKLIDNVTVFSSDLSDLAVELTKQNIEFLSLQNKVTVIQSDLFSSFDNDKYYKSIDIVVCNPPYISSAKVAKMNIEISANEPPMAFDGGMLGMKIIQRVISESPKYLRDLGWVIFEIGVGQGPFLLKLFESSTTYKKIKTYKDEKGNIRVIAAQYNL